MITRIMKAAAALLMLALTAAVLLLGYDVHLDLVDIDIGLRAASGAGLDSEVRITALADRLANHADRVLDTAQQAEQKLNDSEDAQLESVARSEKLMADSAAAGKLFLIRTDRSLNDGLLPRLDAAIDQFSRASTASLNSVTLAGNDLDAQLKDPQVDELVGHLNVTALHLAGISANGEAMSADMKTAVHRMAASPTKLHQALSVAWTTAKFGSLFVP